MTNPESNQAEPKASIQLLTSLDEERNDHSVHVFKLPNCQNGDEFLHQLLGLLEKIQQEKDGEDNHLSHLLLPLPGTVMNTDSDDSLQELIEGPMNAVQGRLKQPVFLIFEQSFASHWETQVTYLLESLDYYNKLAQKTFYGRVLGIGFSVSKLPKEMQADKAVDFIMNLSEKSKNLSLPFFIHGQVLEQLEDSNDFQPDSLNGFRWSIPSFLRGESPDFYRLTVN